MAVTATLVFVGHNSLRYLLAQDGQAGTTKTITTTGAATPDLLTDSVQGPIKKLAKAFTDGYGSLPAGALTQAQARALWMSDRADAANAPSAGDPAGAISLVPTAKCWLSPTSIPASMNWRVEANVDGSGHPTLNITAQAGAGNCYLDVEISNAIGA
jgi:hypothetical protein